MSSLNPHLAMPMAEAPLAAQREAVVLLTGYLSWRALRGRRELGLILSRDETERLAELNRVFDRPASDPPCLLLLPRMHERHSLRLPVSFHDPDGAVHDGLLSDISMTGFFVHTLQPGTLGERVGFKFVDHAAFREWHFAGEVVRVPGEGMGLRFVGIPVEVHVRLGTAPLLHAA